MSEIASPFPEELQPGTVIELVDTSRLAEFEDTLFPYLLSDKVTPEFAQEYWEGRSSLKELVRPKSFNGRISDVELEVMDDPYDRLLDVRERFSGVMNISGYSVGRNINGPTRDPASVLGFKFHANASSSGRGSVGNVESEIWYAPSTNAAKYQGGIPIDRYVAKPRVDGERFREVDETSRRIGLTVLRYNLAHPFRG